MKYKDLYQTHTDYCKSLIENVEILHCGEREFIKNITRFLPKMYLENDETYIARCNSSSYVNHLSNIVCSIKNFLLENKICVSFKNVNDVLKDKLSDFIESLTTKLDEIVTSVLLHGRAFVLLDDLQINEASSRWDVMDAEAPHLTVLKCLDVINWEFEDDDIKQILVRQIHDVNTSLIGSHIEKYDTFIHCEKQDDAVKCTIYKSKIYESSEKASNYKSLTSIFNKNKIKIGDVQNQILESDVEIVLETILPKMPFFCFSVSNDLAIGAKVVGLLIELIQRRSKLLVAEQRGLCAIPTMFLGPAIKENEINESTDSKDVNPRQEYINNGFLVLGSDDKMEFVEPEGKIVEVCHNLHQDLVDDIYKICFMSSLQSKKESQKGLSGLSKQIDLMTLTLVVSRLATILKDFIQEIVEYFEETRGVQLEYHVSGLDQSSQTDTVDSLKAEVEFLEKISIPSETFKKMYASKIASFCLKQSIQEDVMLEILKEINESKNTLESPQTLQDENN